MRGQKRFPLAVHYLFARDIYRVSFWVSLFVMVPSILYYAVLHHALPALLRDFVAKSPEEQHVILAQFDALTFPSIDLLLLAALAFALPILLVLFVARLTQPNARLSSREVPPE